MRIRMKKTWLLALFFSWLYVFPYYGIILGGFLQSALLPGNWLVYYFIIFHALGYFCGAIILKRVSSSRAVMLYSLSIMLICNTALWLFSDILLLPGLALLGFTSSLFVLGWSYLFSAGSNAERAWVVINMAIRSHLIALIILLLNSFVASQLKLALVLAPLLIAFALITFPQKQPQKYPLISLAFIKPVPIKFFIIFCLFIAVVKLTAGFIYSVIHISYSVMESYIIIFRYFEYLPHILLLIILLRYYRTLNKEHIAFAGVTLLGLAYISFALFGDTLHGYIITTILIEAAFALINIFTWLLLGSLSKLFGMPHWFFGIGLAVTAGITVIGGIIGDNYLMTSAMPYFNTALIASGLIFISLLIILWLRTNDDYKLIGFSYNAVVGSGGFSENIDDILNAAAFTKREIEIVTLMLQGKTNRATAEALHITENTMKSHCRNIYEKLEVKNKSELLVKLASKD